MKKLFYYLSLFCLVTSCIVENNYYQVVPNKNIEIYTSSLKIGRPVQTVYAGSSFYMTKVSGKRKQRAKYNNGTRDYLGYVFNVTPYDYTDYVEPRKKEIELPAYRYQPASPTSTPSYNSSPSYNTPNRDIQTGPRGGRYYINSHGNKTYIKKGH